jgi:hypothetical protein
MRKTDYTPEQLCGDAANGAIGEREAFESWAKGRYSTRHIGTYMDRTADAYEYTKLATAALDGWKARASLVRSTETQDDEAKFQALLTEARQYKFRDSTYDALDVLDAALFSGDEFLTPLARTALRYYMARFERKLKEFDETDLGEES